MSCVFLCSFSFEKPKIQEAGKEGKGRTSSLRIRNPILPLSPRSS